MALLKMVLCKLLRGENNMFRKHLFKIILLTLYIVTASIFGYQFVTLSIPIVGWDYVIENWVEYVMLVVGGHAYFGMFFAFALFMESIGQLLNSTEA